MNVNRNWLALVGAIVLGGYVLRNGTADVSADAGSSTVKGTVSFSGAAPAPVKIKVTADPKCHDDHAQSINSEDYVVGKKGELKNVFIYVKQGLEGQTFPPAATPVSLNQMKCQYTPHVIGAQAGQNIEIMNSDPTMHNVNTLPKNNRGFNIAQPIQGMKTLKKFDKPEVMIAFVCNVHPWMKSYIGVVDHPFFAVSNELGQFEIKGLPAGTYTLEAWHEKLGAKTLSVTVGAGETKTAGFTFSKS